MRNRNNQHLVIDHVQPKNTDGILDLLTPSSSISDVVARCHCKLKRLSGKSNFSRNMSCCRTASFAPKSVALGCGLHALHFRGTVDKNNVCSSHSLGIIFSLSSGPAGFFLPNQQQKEMAGSSINMWHLKNRLPCEGQYMRRGGHLWVEKKA